MELDKKDIIREFENQISGLLRQRYLPEDRPIESVFQIIHEPSFEEKTSWEIFRTEKQENKEYYFVVKSIWNKTEDYSKLDVPLVALKMKYNKGQIIPTIKREKMHIEKSIVDEMLLQLSNIKISPIPSNRSEGADGTSYELRVNLLFANCHFKWWEEGPKNWSELTSYAINVLEYFSKIERGN